MSHRNHRNHRKLFAEANGLSFLTVCFVWFFFSYALHSVLDFTDEEIDFQT